MIYNGCKINHYIVISGRLIAISVESAGPMMQVPITVLFPDDMYIHLKLWIDQPEMTIDLPALPYEPKKIIFNTYDAVLCEVDYE